MDAVDAVARDPRLRRLGAAEVQVVTDGAMDDGRRDEVFAELTASLAPLLRRANPGTDMTDIAPTTDLAAPEPSQDWPLAPDEGLEPPKRALPVSSLLGDATVAFGIEARCSRRPGTSRASWSRSRSTAAWG